MLGGHAVDDEQEEGERTDARLHADLGRLEPVERAAPVEHQLQHADGQRQQAEAEQVERARFLAHVGQVGHRAEEGEHAHRQVDQEDPVPGIVLGQPAAQQRPDQRPHDETEAEDRHRFAALFRGVQRHQDDLADRDQRGSEHALQEPEDHQLLKVLGDAAKARDKGETGNRDQQHGAPPEAFGQPAAQRRGDGHGDDIARQHPRNLLARGRSRPLHMRQGNVGDGGIHLIHDRRRHDRHGDQVALRLGKILRL